MAQDVSPSTQGLFGEEQPRVLCPKCGSDKQVDRFPCPYCASMNVKNKGLKRGKSRQFRCRNCEKCFSVRILCFLSENPKLRIKKPKPTLTKQPKPQKPKLEKPRKKLSTEMQEIKENYVSQTVDSLVGVPCFCCSEQVRCNPCLCAKLTECLK